MEMAGLGRDALRLIPCDEHGRMCLDRLAARVTADRSAGLRPFLVVGSAGTVDIGAIDDLVALGDFARQEALWFHVDGAFGAVGMLSPQLRPLLAGIERADSVAFDFHKWAQVPYDAGCIMVRDQARQVETFSNQAAYLRREQRGLAGGGVWPCDLGPDLSRGFRALKVWMTLLVYGADRIGAVAEHTCRLAALLAELVDQAPDLERLAPVALNIVCFRFVAPVADLDTLNAELIADLQIEGIAAPSTTRIDGVLAIRAAIVNHRTTASDMRLFVRAVVRVGVARLAGLIRPSEVARMAGAHGVVEAVRLAESLSLVRTAQLADPASLAEAAQLAEPANLSGVAHAPEPMSARGIGLAHAGKAHVALADHR